MIDSILKYKADYQKLSEKNKEFSLQPNLWPIVEDLHRVLKPAWEATTKMQELLPITDIYEEWMVSIKKI